jgi:acyl dehydratase
MGFYFEDLVVDAPVELGSHTFGRAEIMEFARKYDPQPFHLDDEAARRSLFGSLSASGWHTAAVWLRLLVDHRNREADFMRFRGERPARYGPSPGFEQLKWIKPVLVGDTLRFTSRVIEKRDVRSRPEVGLVIYQNEGTNQKGEVVFQITSKIFVERRTKLTSE